MSCQNYKSTINIVENKVNTQKCSADCEYSYSHNPNSSCIVINKGAYLEIKTDGTDHVKFNSVDQSILSIRLYQPSIHLFDGAQVDAELIIQYLGTAQNLFVCMPIIGEDTSGPSNTFFSKFIPFVNGSEKNTTQIIQTNSWSLNDALGYNIPYFYYIGSYPYSPCNGTASIIVFDKKNAAKINLNDLKSLKSYITATPKAAAGSEGFLMYNNKGPIDPNNPNGKSEYDLVSCREVEGLADNSTGVVSDSDAGNSIFKKLGEGGAGSYGAIFGYIVLGLLLIAFLLFGVFPKMDTFFRSMQNRPDGPGIQP